MTTSAKTGVRVGIGRDAIGWHERFLERVEEHRAAGVPIEGTVVNLDANDWMDVAARFDAIVWKPVFMGPAVAAQFQAKIRFLEREMGRIVMPNEATIWHFENKVAQSYLFRREGVPTPHTFASFDPDDALAQLDREQFPLVFKRPYGASSDRVQLVRTRDEARRLVGEIFARQRWSEMRQTGWSLMAAAREGWKGRWLHHAVRQRLLSAEPWQCVYWQEFIPGNTGDLRITAIGDQTAFGFWRGNRPNDFRASGSGRLRYEPVPEEAVRFCLELNRRLGFDSMAYDILQKDGRFLIVEMSYAYLAKAVFNTPGSYVATANGGIEWREGHRWPQAAWIDWLVTRLQRKGRL